MANTKQNGTKEHHVELPIELDARLVKYKQSKYNGLRAMNKVLTDCIRLGLVELEKRG